MCRTSACSWQPVCCSYPARNPAHVRLLGSNMPPHTCHISHTCKNRMPHTCAPAWRQGFDKEFDRVLEENKQLQRRLAQVDSAFKPTFDVASKKDI